MSEKKPFVANKNHFYVFFGLFLCLLSLILCLNTGPVARVLSTPFTYAFGSVSYLLYLAVNIIGLRMIFAKKFISIKINIYFIATLVLFVAALMYYAHFALMVEYGDNQYVALATDDTHKTISFLEAFNNNFAAVEGGYMKVQFLALFFHPFASGICGYFLVGASNALFGISKGGLIIAIVVTVFAILLYFLPLILRLIGQCKQKDVKVNK